MEMRSSVKSASVTRTQSITLVKNLFRAAFSSIAYIRNFFHEDVGCSLSKKSFSSFVHAPPPLPLFHPDFLELKSQYFRVCKVGKASYYRICNTNNEDVRTFVDWLECGVFDALKRRYLDVVVLEVYKTPERNASTIGIPSSAGELLECFSFKVIYSDDNTQISLSGRAATSAPTNSRHQLGRDIADVLRNLVSLTHTLRPLPKNHNVGIKVRLPRGTLDQFLILRIGLTLLRYAVYVIFVFQLYYTPETPADYEPPMFRPVSEEGESWFVEKPLRASAGIFLTPFHQMRMTIRAQANAENTKARVLVTDEDGSGNEEESVDVGSGQNSGRAGNVATKQEQTDEKAQKVVAEEEMQRTPQDGTQESGICKLRIRAPQSNKKAGQKKRGMGTETKTTSILKAKKRKVSAEQKKIPSAAQS